MDDLVRLFPRKLVVAVVGSFLLGVASLVLLVELTPVVRTLLYVVFVGGVVVFAVLGVGLSLVVRQSRGLESVDGGDE